jgi:nicotinamide-nucleotide amidase
VTNAELIAVGSELLQPGRPDTNGDWLVERLERAGVEVTGRAVVDDHPGRIESLVRSAIERSTLVIVTGGLGPTDDDRTREALAAAFGLPLASDPAALRGLEERLARFGRDVTPEQARQALLPRGASWIPNPIGSAPGIAIERAAAAGARLLIALPGVPAEMRVMFDGTVAPRLAARVPGGGVARRRLRIGGRTESHVDRELRGVEGVEPSRVTLLAGEAGVEVLLSARGPSAAAARAALDGLERQVRDRLGSDVIGADDETLAGVVGDLLLRSRRTLATCESCTAGLLAAEVTRVPGSSAWYRGGLVVYHDDLKQELAGVGRDLLGEHGAVSEPAARALARAARVRCHADLGVGVTGIAGPGGGSPGKPVGRVHLAIEDATQARVWKLDLAGDRDAIRRRAVGEALDRLRRLLLLVAPAKR